MPEEVGLGAPAPQQSFTERKAAQLAQERVERGENIPVTPADPVPGTPHEEQESVDVGQDEPQGLYADEATDQFELEGSPEDLVDELPPGEDQALEDSNTDWEKRYKDLQSETQAIREARGEMEQEQAQAMSQHLELRFELEDKLTEAVNRAEFMHNAMSGQAQRFQNIDWSQIPPDKVQEVQAQAQQAFMLHQQSEQAYTQMQAQVEQTRNQVKEREAAIAKVRLRRTIPNWGNDTYSEIRDFAANQGMSAREFNDITNPVIVEALHTAMTIKRANSGVQTSTTRKAQAPRGKAARKQPRTSQGKFAKTQIQPNQRGSFADKHRHRLAMEREGR